MCQPFINVWAKICSIGLVAFGASLSPAQAQIRTDIQQVNSYSDVADLVLSAPVIVQATIKKTTRIKGADALGVPPGHVRFLTRATVTRLIAGRQGVPGEINYLVDLPFDARGRAPKLAKANLLLFLKPVPGRDDQFTLAGRNAQRPWSAEIDATTVAVAREAQGSLGNLSITGIGNAFHVPGSIPGESETQVFLTTADQRPVSLSVLRRPGETPRWFVSLGEIVADSDQPVGRNTLLWYKLACFLPQAIPADVTERLAQQRDAVTADYRFVLQSLGPCRG